MRIVLKGHGYRSKLIEKSLTCQKAPDHILLAARRVGVPGKTYLDLLENLGAYSISIEKRPLYPGSRKLTVYVNLHIKGGWHGIGGVTYKKALSMYLTKLIRWYADEKAGVNRPPRRKRGSKSDRHWQIIP
jgi:hypothetical protein